ncbi:hypothetical protein LS69_009900 [Helicobacter sp. MIT 05-5294]|nr:hypothetical protein LS69_009900 [Helicobacter sp. MIT 05-5294]
MQTNPSANIDMGCLLVRRIIDRLENPTIETIGTLYNSLAKERISNYGRILLHYYENKSWLHAEVSDEKGSQ